MKLTTLRREDEGPWRDLTPGEEEGSLRRQFLEEKVRRGWQERLPVERWWKGWPEVHFVGD